MLKNSKMELISFLYFFNLKLIINLEYLDPHLLMISFKTIIKFYHFNFLNFLL